LARVFSLHAQFFKVVHLNSFAAFCVRPSSPSIVWLAKVVVGIVGAMAIIGDFVFWFEACVTCGCGALGSTAGAVCAAAAAWRGTAALPGGLPVEKAGSTPTPKATRARAAQASIDQAPLGSRLDGPKTTM
jgi:hypothetical protein